MLSWQISGVSNTMVVGSPFKAIFPTKRLQNYEKKLRFASFLKKKLLFNVSFFSRPPASI